MCFRQINLILYHLSKKLVFYILQICQAMPPKQNTKSKISQLLMEDEESGEAVEIVEGEENNAE